MSSQSLPLTPLTATPWIIGRRQDLTWFIGPALVSYAVLGLLAAGFPMTPLFLIWLIGIDGPHVVATVTRTYFDPAERRRLGSLLWVVLPAMTMGPLMILAGAASLFYLVATTWLHFHIAKQHFGFVMLYKHKVKDRAQFDFVLDRWFLLGSLMLPFARFAGRSFYPFLMATAFMQIAQRVLFVAYAVGAAMFILRQVYLWRQGIALNRPKLLLFAAIVPLQWITFEYATGVTEGVVQAGIVLGLFHSFQYHRLMWFHNRNRYDHEQGLAGILAQRFVYYFGAVVGLYLLLSMLPGWLVPGPYMNAALWGIPFTHYILDSVIWRVRGNKELASALRLG